mmetsp:Transcript_5240/g.22275  ORF Transcript_5240/g.22275 Transcript_5240/m.22275 type:complete len:298 (-) Transcript_5240:3324-4217(-)
MSSRGVRPGWTVQVESDGTLTRRTSRGASCTRVRAGSLRRWQTSWRRHLPIRRRSLVRSQAGSSAPSHGSLCPRPWSRNWASACRTGVASCPRHWKSCRLPAAPPWSCCRMQLSTPRCSRLPTSKQDSRSRARELRPGGRFPGPCGVAQAEAEARDPWPETQAQEWWLATCALRWQQRPKSGRSATPTRSCGCARSRPSHGLLGCRQTFCLQRAPQRRRLPKPSLRPQNGRLPRETWRRPCLAACGRRCVARQRMLAFQRASRSTVATPTPCPAPKALVPVSQPTRSFTASLTSRGT